MGGLSYVEEEIQELNQKAIALGLVMKRNTATGEYKFSIKGQEIIVFSRMGARELLRGYEWRGTIDGYDGGPHKWKDSE